MLGVCGGEVPRIARGNRVFKLPCGLLLERLRSLGVEHVHQLRDHDVLFSRRLLLVRELLDYHVHLLDGLRVLLKLRY